MDSAQYRKLNNYLNKCLTLLQERDSFLIDNALEIAKISTLYYQSFRNEILYIDDKDEGLTYDDVLKLAREIIGDLSPEYLTEFDQMIINGTIDFGYENEYKNSEMQLYSNGTKLININRKYNYYEVCTIIHEFIHMRNANHKINNKNRYLLTEFLSIYSEEYAKKYLVEEKGIPESKINVNPRIQNILIHAKNFNMIYTLFISFVKFGPIGDNSYKDMSDNLYRVGKDGFEAICHFFLELFEKLENEYRMQIMYKKEFDENEFFKGMILPLFNESYRYILGFVLASYALKYVDKDKIVYLCDHINDAENVEKDVLTLLKSIGIDFNAIKLSKYIEIIKEMMYVKGLVKK